MTTATATNTNDPIAEVQRRVDAIVARGILSEAAAHKKVMKSDASLRHKYVIAWALKHDRVKGGLQYARRIR